MKPSRSKALLYVDDDVNDDTYVFDYPSGELVGKLTHFHNPRGMCVDQKGDVYISNYNDLYVSESRVGLLIEYAHGGTKPIKTYTAPNVHFLGCSISANGDVSATSYDGSEGAGEVCIWKVSKANPTCIAGSTSLGCYYLLPFGYDHDGNLVGLADLDGRITACMVPAGAATMETLHTSRVKFSFDPEGTSWDGKYIVLGGYHLHNGAYETDLQPVVLTGTKLTGIGSHIYLLDDCGGEPEIISPFFFGKQNVTAASTRRATGVTGPNRWCKISKKSVADAWRYPRTGHEPLVRVPAALDIGGDAISIEQ